MSQLTPTMDRPTTINLTDINGIEKSLLHIDGQPLEEYFASGALSVPVAGQVPIMDGFPIDAKDPVPAGSTIVVGLLPSNG